MDDIRLSVVVVSHNSENVLSQCFDSLQRQTLLPDAVYLVDSGSYDRKYLDTYRTLKNVTVLEEDNIGFASANNKGFAECCRNSDFVLFLNPDAFLDRRFIERATAYMEAYPKIGIAGGKIYWFDSKMDNKTTILDSTGIFRSWYGRWYDRGQGVEDRGQFNVEEEVTAICGAAMCCRCAALKENDQPRAFDPDFFLYKEDIELCLRVHKKGWSIKYFPNLIAYHGRGWKKERKTIPFFLRRTAAESELLLYKKHPSPYMLWAIFKYMLVRIMRF